MELLAIALCLLWGYGSKTALLPCAGEKHIWKPVSSWALLSSWDVGTEVYTPSSRQQGDGWVLLSLHCTWARALPLATVALSFCTDLLNPNLYFFLSLKNSRRALNGFVSPLPIHFALLPSSTLNHDKMPNIFHFHCNNAGCIQKAQTI